MIIITALMVIIFNYQFYRPAKEVIISEVVNEFMAETHSKNLPFWIRLVDDYIVMRKNRHDHPLLMKKLEEMAIEILFDKSPIFRLQIVDNGGMLISTYDNYLKYEESNSLKYNLLFSFENSFIVKSNLGKIVFFYTNPVNEKKIISLTTKWQSVILPMVVIILVFQILFNLRVVIPLKKVVSYLEKPRSSVDSLIDNPVTLLEKLYNRKARDSILWRIELLLGDFISSNKDLTVDSFFHKLPRLLNDIFPGFIFSCYRNFTTIFDSQTRNQLQENGKPLLKEELYLIHTDLSRQNIKYALLFPIFFQDRIYGFGLLDMNKNNYYRFPLLVMETIGLIGNQIGISCNYIDIQRKLIMKEKSLANINLAKNLGHDLTNIIASGKLELMAITSYMKNIEKKETVNRQDSLFINAINNLKNNIKFLQEIVNIYRSYTYIHSPKFESINIFQTIEELLELFRLTTSGDINFNLDSGGKNIIAKVEPRLLKLAMFNIITNAVDSVKARQINEVTRGEIYISISSCTSEKCFEIKTRDNGQGILDKEGNELSPTQISRIFNFGYSTKDSSLKGEGLGLSWVLAIVDEFHCGQINAENNQNLGSTFTIKLPINRLQECSHLDS